MNLLRGEGFVGAVNLHGWPDWAIRSCTPTWVTADRVRGEDGRWSAPDIRPVYAEAKIAGTIADAVIRDALTKSPGVPTLAYRRDEDRRAGA